MNCNEKIDMTLKPIILYRNMRPVIFRKDGYSVRFPTDALNRLYELAMGAEELNIEINAKLLVKNSEVTEVLFPKLDKIVVIDTMLPFEIKANDRRYFDDTAIFVRMVDVYLSGQSVDKSSIICVSRVSIKSHATFPNLYWANSWAISLRSSSEMRTNRTPIPRGVTLSSGP